MEDCLLAFPKAVLRQRFDTIAENYRLMMDYWRQGYEDRQRQQVYQGLLQDMYMLAADMMLKAKWGTAAERDAWLVGLPGELENFVSETAMLELEPAHVRSDRQRALYERHELLMDRVFNQIRTSLMWTEGTARAVEGILLSPTVDANDQQLMVSAITLAVMNVFDFQKFAVLCRVYQKAADERVRQRALVGWALSASADMRSLYPLMADVVNETLSHDDWQQEVVELQLQMVYCYCAEADRQLIQNEIMPELLKNNNIKIGRNGVEEIEDDPMEDVLNPDAAEQRMERLEETMQRMQDMQKEGSDIYFGGFSQMKRFPFFNALSHWLTPFYPQHPGVNGVWQQSKGNRFLQAITTVGTFCDSDKYSFVLAFQQIVDHLPADMVSMMERGEATMEGLEDMREQMETPAYLRRMYLQDVYRFFRLNPRRGEFRNPFVAAADETHPFVFVSSPLFATSLAGEHIGRLAAFLQKRKLPADAAALLAGCPDERRDYLFYVLCGHFALRGQAITPWKPAGQKPLGAVECYAAALRLKPGARRALVGYARALFAEGKYAEAANAYSQLADQEPDNRSYLLNKAVCLSALRDYDGALKLLYQLDYEQADDMNVKRVLAWTLMGAGKLPEALRLYDRLTAADQSKPLPEDLLNAGLCHWLANQTGQAIGFFERFMQTQTQRDTATTFRDMLHDEERQLLRNAGIGDIEVQLMIEAVEK